MLSMKKVFTLNNHYALGFAIYQVILTKDHNNFHALWADVEIFDWWAIYGMAIVTHKSCSV